MALKFTSPVKITGNTDVGHGSILTSDFGMGGYIDAQGKQVTFNRILPDLTPAQVDRIKQVLSGGESGCSWDGKPIQADDASNATKFKAGPGSGGVQQSYAGRAEPELKEVLKEWEAAHPETQTVTPTTPRPDPAPIPAPPPKPPKPPVADGAAKKLADQLRALADEVEGLGGSGGGGLHIAGQ